MYLCVHVCINLCVCLLSPGGSNHYNTCVVCSDVLNNALHVIKEASQEDMARYGNKIFLLVFPKEANFVPIHLIL